VKIVEGESTLPAECTPLGICDVILPPFLPKGSPVHLSYQYNTNQVLEVVVEAAGQRSQVVVERNTGVAHNDIPRAANSLGELKIE
jgi:molecular chaperone DnaK